jgi:UDP-glucose 4-epimerase
MFIDEAKKSVLLTGSSGFIGQATVCALRESGWNVTCGIRSKSMQGTDCCYIDLERPETIFSLGKERRFSAIIHLGSCIGFKSSLAEMYASNILSTGCLAHLSEKWGAKFIFSSTAMVHGIYSENINDKSPILADTAYGESKWLAEQLINASCDGGGGKIAFRGIVCIKWAIPFRYK